MQQLTSTEHRWGYYIASTLVIRLLRMVNQENQIIQLYDDEFSLIENYNSPPVSDKVLATKCFWFFLRIFYSFNLLPVLNNSIQIIGISGTVSEETLQ
jgi:hypothetical protein